SLPFRRSSPRLTARLLPAFPQTRIARAEPALGRGCPQARHELLTRTVVPTVGLGAVLRLPVASSGLRRLPGGRGRAGRGRGRWGGRSRRRRGGGLRPGRGAG